MNVAFIPVRGGSKSIPLKNIKPFNGRPLVFWTVKAACQCRYIDTVYVATDSEKISETVEQIKAAEGGCFEKIQVIGRSPESAADTASTESAMLEFAGNYSFDTIVLIQATSPLLTEDDLDRGFCTYEMPDTDSVLSVVRQKRFSWTEDEHGFAHAENYDVFKRPRRQEFDGCLIENGAFYITSRQRLLQTKNRISGHIRAVEMPEDTFFEIDEPSDWIISEALMKKRMEAASPRAKQARIKMLLTDCDGCMTDGGMYYSEHGDEMKKFNTRDGYGIALLRQNGILTGIITGERVYLNRRRAEKIMVDEFHEGVKDKLAVVKKVAEKHGLALEEIAYIGDDMNDLPVINAVGFGCCPQDAVKEIRAAADYVSGYKGGEGVIRDVAERLLRQDI